MVIVEEEDFQKAVPGKMDYLEIIQVVDEKEVDAVYYEKPYYLEPEKNGVRAYALLREVLKKDNAVALGPFVFHKREWIGLIKPYGNALMLHRLRFAEEIKEQTKLSLPEGAIKGEELKLASSLLKELKAPFKPEQFKDQYREKLLQVIEAKSKGKTSTVKQMKVVHSATEDLMAKLKASMKAPTKKAS
jgi:DNA end-binding protein Ku